MNVKGIEIEIINGNDGIAEQEIEAYVDRGLEKYGNKLEKMKICFDGDNVEITYNFAAVPFERIRRITGYLVGTVDRWNDAKAAELHDRVKHGVERR